MGKKLAYVVAPAATLGLVLATPSAAVAHGGHDKDTKRDVTVTTADLDEMNDSGAQGKAIVVLRGNEAKVKLFVRGVLAGSPHAQHFHINGAGQCPTPDDDANGDGIVSTVEGQDAYGEIGTSLTTEGDTSADSGLAVDRFPTPSHGVYSYHRTMTLTDDAAENVRSGNAVVVVHGIDPNGSGAYDGDAKSELDPSLPLEATAPASCGGLDRVGQGHSGDDGLLGGLLDDLLGDVFDDVPSGSSHR